MSMEFSGEYRIPAPPQAVWNALNDPAVLQACIAGCKSLEKISDTEFASTVAGGGPPPRAHHTDGGGQSRAPCNPFAPQQRTGMAGCCRLCGRHRVRLHPLAPGVDLDVGGNTLRTSKSFRSKR